MSHHFGLPSLHHVVVHQIESANDVVEDVDVTDTTGSGRGVKREVKGVCPNELCGVCVCVCVCDARVHTCTTRFATQKQSDGGII